MARKSLEKLMLLGSMASVIVVDVHASCVSKGYVEAKDCNDCSVSVTSPGGYIHTKLCRCLSSDKSSSLDKKSFDAMRKKLHLLELNGRLQSNKKGGVPDTLANPNTVFAQTARIWEEADPDYLLQSRGQNLGIITTSKETRVGQFVISEDELAGKVNILNTLKRLENALGSEVLLLNVDGGWFLHPTFFTSLHSSREGLLVSRSRHGVLGDENVRAALKNKLAGNDGTTTLPQLKKEYDERCRQYYSWDFSAKEDDKVLFVLDHKNKKLYLVVDEGPETAGQFEAFSDSGVSKVKYYMKEHGGQISRCCMLGLAMAVAAYYFLSHGNVIGDGKATKILDENSKTDFNTERGESKIEQEIKKETLIDKVVKQVLGDSREGDARAIDAGFLGINDPISLEDYGDERNVDLSLGELDKAIVSKNGDISIINSRGQGIKIEQEKIKDYFDYQDIKNIFELLKVQKDVNDLYPEGDRINSFPDVAEKFEGELRKQIADGLLVPFGN